MFEIVNADGPTPEHRYTIVSCMSLCSGELKSNAEDLQLY